MHHHKQSVCNQDKGDDEVLLDGSYEPNEPDHNYDIEQQIDIHIIDSPAASRLYLDHQVNFCSKIYGPKCFSTNTWDSFANACLENEHSQAWPARKSNAIKIFNFINSASLSNRRSVELIKLFKDIGNPDDIPIGLGQTKRLALEGLSSKSALDLEEFVLSDVVPYPNRWRMDLWNDKKQGFQLSPVAILARDPIACISAQFMDPSIAFLNRSHLHFEYEATCLEGKYFIFNH
jgi:hypothetical protein